MESEALARKKELIKEWKHPLQMGEVKLSKPKPKIEVNCKQYSMIIHGNHPRPKKKAARSVSRSRSKSRTPVVTFGVLLASEKKRSEHVATATPKKTQIKGIRKVPNEPDALGTLNLQTTAKRVRFQDEFEEALIAGQKRKRWVEETEMSAENIPLEKVFPVLQFGMNKDMYPKKRRRLQSLFPSEM